LKVWLVTTADPAGRAEAHLSVTPVELFVDSHKGY